MTSLSPRIQQDLNFHLLLTFPVKQTNKIPLLFKPVTLQLNGSPERQQPGPCCFWKLLSSLPPNSCQILSVGHSLLTVSDSLLPENNQTPHLDAIHNTISTFLCRCLLHTHPTPYYQPQDFFCLSPEH